MTNNDIKDKLQAYLPEYLEGKGINIRNNFKCLNPEHDDDTPSMSYDPNRNKVHCFGQCNSDFSLFDLIGFDYDLTGDFKTQLQKAGELFNTEIPPQYNANTRPSRPKIDFTGYYTRIRENVTETPYLTNRGISLKTQQNAGIGYDPNWTHPTPADPNSKQYPSPRIIIPANNYSYLARDTTGTQGNYSKLYAGDRAIYNLGALYAVGYDYCFIVEGEIDVLSMVEAGESLSIGLGGVNVNLLIDALKELKTTKPKTLLIMLDNDNAGAKSTARIMQQAESFHNVKLQAVQLPAKYKDANDALLDLGADDFKMLLDDIKNNPDKHQRQLPESEPNNELQTDLIGDFYDIPMTDNHPIETLEPAPDDQENGLISEFLALDFDKLTIGDRELRPFKALLANPDFKENHADKIAKLHDNTSPAHHLSDFVSSITASTPAIKTGFDELDAKLGGGLYEGLYFIGAISSLGKTTFLLQVADQIAQQYPDRLVFIFSLEMSRAEIMAKSISRLTYELMIERGIPEGKAKTTRGITAHDRYEKYDATESQLIKDSIKKYGEYAKNIRIYEGVGDIGVEQVAETIEFNLEANGIDTDIDADKRPIIIIDYLQILAPNNDRATDKQNTDKAVVELKRLSRDYKIPVMAISSFNRESYSKSVSMASFKESGAVEYSSDVLIGLQFQKQTEVDKYNATKKSTDPAKTVNHDLEKAKTPREIELKILKNRNGLTGRSINFDYDPRFNHYAESAEQPSLTTQPYDLKINSDKVSQPKII